MATLGLLSLAVFLQVLAGLIPILYEDLNPARGLPMGEGVLNAPRSTPLVLLLTRNDSRDNFLERELAERFSGRSDLSFVVLPLHYLDDLRYQPPGGRGFFGVSPGLLHSWYSRPAQMLDIADMRPVGLTELPTQLDELPTREEKVYCALWRPFGRQDWELVAYRKIWQRSSLLLVGVAALARFAYGEPILRLF